MSLKSNSQIHFKDKLINCHQHRRHGCSLSSRLNTICFYIFAYQNYKIFSTYIGENDRRMMNLLVNIWRYIWIIQSCHFVIFLSLNKWNLLLLWLACSFPKCVASQNLKFKKSTNHWVFFITDLRYDQRM